MRFHPSCPFETARQYAESLKSRGRTQAILVEIHAERNVRKKLHSVGSLRWYPLDSGRRHAYAHVPTADNRVAAQRNSLFDRRWDVRPVWCNTRKGYPAGLRTILDQNAEKDLLLATGDVASRGCVVEIDERWRCALEHALSTSKAVGQSRRPINISR